MKVTLEYDLDKQDDRQEYMVITKSAFLEEVINEIIQIVFDDVDLSDDNRLKMIREKLEQYKK